MDFIKTALITAIAITLYYLLLQWPNDTQVYETNNELPIENKTLIDSNDSDEFGPPRGGAIRIAIEKLSREILNQITSTW